MNIILPVRLHRIFSLLLKHGGKILLLSLCVITLSNCGNSYAPSMVPMMESGRSYKNLNANSVSDAQRTIVKTGSLGLKASNIRETGEAIEQIVANKGGYITSMSEQSDETKSASYEIRVPAQQLISTMDTISQLGKVTHRRIYVKDVTAEAIKHTARLNSLKARRDRLKALYSRAKTIADKLKIEESISEIEEEIFNMEAAIKEMQKTSSFSKLSLSVKRAKIRGPLGIVKDSSAWSLKKLFTLRE